MPRSPPLVLHLCPPMTINTDTTFRFMFLMCVHTPRMFCLATRRGRLEEVEDQRQEPSSTCAGCWEPVGPRGGGGKPRFSWRRFPGSQGETTEQMQMLLLLLLYILYASPLARQLRINVFSWCAPPPEVATLSPPLINSKASAASIACCIRALYPTANGSVAF